MTMWPISPAVPLKPEYNLPSTMMPPPMPVPMKMPTMYRGLDCSSFSNTPSVALIAIVLHRHRHAQLLSP